MWIGTMCRGLYFRFSSVVFDQTLKITQYYHFHNWQVINRSTCYFSIGFINTPNQWYIMKVVNEKVLTIILLTQSIVAWSHIQRDYSLYENWVVDINLLSYKVYNVKSLQFPLYYLYEGSFDDKIQELRINNLSVDNLKLNFDSQYKQYNKCSNRDYT